MRTFKKHLFILFSLILFFSCHPKDQSNEDDTQLGIVEFSVSGNKEAVPYFEKGLLLLHSFEYDDAREAFSLARERDPDFAMAYWGESLTYNHSLWRSQDYEKGKSVLEKLGADPNERLEKAPTEIEKDFLQAVEILYGEGSKYDRDQAYKQQMQMMHEKYPNNNEVAAFYALSLLGSVETGRDDEIFEKSAKIAQGILQENPNHPGALHYLIHSYDDPYHAYKAIQAANNYSEVAPDAAHALHMPSHIYVAMGMWDNVISSNIDSWEASVNRMLAKELDNDAQSYHALHWLLYGYLQKGMAEESEEIMNDMVRYTNELPSRRARAYMVAMQGAYLVENDSWGGDFSNIETDCSDMNISVRAANYFIKGMNAYTTKDYETLKAVLSSLTKERKEAEVKAFNNGVPVCSVGGYSANNPNKLDVDQAYVMEMELEALVAMSEKDSESVDKWLKKATLLEESISYSYGPPPILKPSHEMYGEWLISQQKGEDALVMFDKSLDRGPNRTLSLKGKLEAAKLLNNEEIVKETSELIEKNLSDIKPSSST